MSYQITPINFDYVFGFITGKLLMAVRHSLPFSGAYLGQVVRLSCQVRLTGPLTEVPTITWENPLSVPNATLFSPEEGLFISEFVIDSFNSSHEGRYSCKASVEGLPLSDENYRTLRINPNCM